MATPESSRRVSNAKATETKTKLDKRHMLRFTASPLTLDCHGETMTLKRLALSFCLVLIPFSAHSQQPAIQDPQAVALVAKAMAALTGATGVNDITLTGTATRTAASDVESGTVVLKALGTTDSRMDLSLSNGTRHEVRNYSSSAPQGSWIGLDGSPHSMSMHNCMTDAAWFAPQLSVLSQLSNPNLIVSYIGQENRAGAAVQHLQFALQSPSTDPTGLFQRLSVEEVYLDASTLLPVALAFTTHPDNDAGVNIPVEIDFSNYRQVNGVQIPFHVQKFFNGTLFLDVTVQSAVLNSGIPPSDF
jgi:hypothetical protein